MQSSGGIKPARDHDIEPGTMIGEYRVESELGRGGMGTVYAAVHPVIAKKAAIKVLHHQLSANREAVERFVQEARAVNQIGHPNIVDIFAFGTLPDGRSYFVMEWLRGESLHDRIARERLPLGDTLVMLESITIALEAAHEKGIVHRDLKPDNVFLVEVKGDRPQVKLLDFGIAKLSGDESKLTQRTQTGNMMGTPAYISPEQARGYAVDHRTDLYALGAMAFELVTGQLVFGADNAADMIAKHLYEAPRRLRDFAPGAPAALDDLLVRLLAKEADARPSLAEAREVLRASRQQLALAMMHGTEVSIDHTAPDVRISSLSRTPVPAAMATATPDPFGQTMAPEARAKGPGLFLAIGGIAAVIAGVIAFVALRGGGDADVAPKPAPALAAPAPAPAPAAVVAPVPVIVPVETPVEVAKPAEVAKPTPPAPRPPTIAKRPPVAPKPAPAKPVAPTVKKPVVDDDAPM